MALLMDFSTAEMWLSTSRAGTDDWEPIATLKTDVVAHLLADAGHDDARASEAATKIGRQIHTRLDPTQAHEQTVVSVPAAVGPLGRRALAVGLCRTGIAVSVSDILSRPLAALASWCQDSTADPPTPSQEVAADQLALIVLNDRRHLSALVAEPRSATVRAVAPLNTGPFEPLGSVRSRLIDLVTVARPRHRGDQPEIDDWATSASRITSVTLIGQPTEDDEVPELCTELFPAASHQRQRTNHVVDGLKGLRRLREWRCSWPTGLTVLGSQGVRGPGPVLDQDDIQPAGGPSALVTGPLQFADAAGVGYSVTAGSVTADGIALPIGLGNRPTLRYLPDGRILVLPSPGTRPLSISVGWPVPGSGAATVTVGAAGRRALELVNPRVSPRRPATAPS